MNKALSLLYNSGFWLSSSKARFAGDCLYTFLGHYAICANITMGQNKKRFSMLPKHHMVSHDAFELKDGSTRLEWIPNPIARTNQLQEDFIGRPSRISRRVSTRSLHRSVLLRSLIIYQESLILAAADDRGMHSYGFG